MRIYIWVQCICLFQYVARDTKDKVVIVVHMTLGATWQVTKTTLMTNGF